VLVLCEVLVVVFMAELEEVVVEELVELLDVELFVWLDDIEELVLLIEGVLY